MLREVRTFLLRQDGGRDLRSYELALQTLDAAEAFARDDLPSAARLASEARPGMFYGRSTATVLMLEADARLAGGTVREPTPCTAIS